METGIFPNTQEGKNWTVVVFKPPENWVDMLKKFFSFLEGHKECMIPHYTVRASTKNEVIISLRVLRGQQDEGFVRSKITEFLKDCEYSIDPEKGELFSEYYAWIPKRETSAMWTKERCVTLNKMSKFALEIISPNTTEGERVQWGHLFSNMMAIFNMISFYQTHENPSLKSAYYFDTRNYHLREIIADYLKNLARELVP